MLEVIGQQVYMLRPFFSRGFSGTRVVERDFRTKTFTLLWDVNQTCVEPIQLAKNLYSIFIVLITISQCFETRPRPLDHREEFRWRSVARIFHA